MRSIIFLSFLLACCLLSEKSFSADTTILSHKMVIGKKQVDMQSTFVISGNTIVWLSPPLAAEMPEKRIGYSISQVQTAADPKSGKPIITYYTVEEGKSDHSIIVIDYSISTIVIMTESKSPGLTITFPFD